MVLVKRQPLPRHNAAGSGGGSGKYAPRPGHSGGTCIAQPCLLIAAVRRVLYVFLLAVVIAFVFHRRYQDDSTVLLEVPDEKVDQAKKQDANVDNGAAPTSKTGLSSTIESDVYVHVAAESAVHQQPTAAGDASTRNMRAASQENMGHENGTDTVQTHGQDETRSRSNGDDAEDVKGVAVPNNPEVNSSRGDETADAKDTENNDIASSTQKAVDGWPEECTLYLARSTIPNSGYGVFTSIDLPKGIQVRSGDVAVPLVDIDWHNQAHYKYKDYHFLYRNYIWSGKSMRMRDVGTNVAVLSHGAGALLNSHQGLINLSEGHPKFDPAGLHRSRDVGAGAFSPYHDRRATTTNMVPAGAELFLDYGPNYFLSRTKSWGYIAMKKDYQRADQFLKTFDKLDKDRRLANGTLVYSTREEFWNLTRHNFFNSNQIRVFNALPETLADAELAIEKGGLKHILQEIKSPEWFKENGKCIDNIRPQPSTIEQAGRGAFATRFIPKGELVISAPLIHSPRGRDVFKMYAQNKTNGRGNYVRDASENAAHVGHQLMLNYAFGHPNSSMLMSPYGPGASLINHNATRANVRLQWADPNHEWFSISVKLLEKDDLGGAQLVLDFVASRDIIPGEEVFLDYGEAWQNAWDDYVQNWSPLEGYENWVSAIDMNKDADETYTNLRNIEEQRSNPYPSNIETWCSYCLPTLEIGSSISKKWNRSADSTISQPCEILSREESGLSSTYTVKFLEQKSHLGRYGKWDKIPGLPRGSSLTVSEMPRKAIKFVDQRYSGDIFLPGAFRHEITVPEDIWPEAWNNLR